MKTLLKVCCIASVEEAEMAISSGATAIGLVGEMPSGPGVIDDATITQIASAVGDRAWTVLLTSRTDAQAIVDHVKQTGVNTVQIVDDPDPATYAFLRQECPDVRILQVLHVEDDRAIDAAIAVENHVDAILLDSGRPSAEVKVLGGTGQQHDWSISRRLVEAVTIPVFLAGGIKPENVADAIADVAPAGIDLCTGVRTDGKLDASKLSDLIAAMH